MVIMNRSQIIRCMIIFTGLVVVIELLTIRVYATGSYSVSMYQQIPTWMIGFGFFITFLSIFSSFWFLTGKYETLSLISLFPLIIQLFIIPMVPFLLGYKIPAGDLLTHAGDIRTIQFHGEIIEAPRARFSSQHRPAFHILSVILDSVTDGIFEHRSNYIVFGVLTSVGNFLYILIIGLIFRRKGWPVVYSIFGALLAMSVSAKPATFAFQTVFMLGLYLLLNISEFESQYKKYSLMFLVVSAGIWPFHQIPPIALTVVTIIVFIIGLTNLYMKSGSSSLPNVVFLFSLTTVVGLFGYLWFTFTPYFRQAIFKLVGSGSETLSAVGQSATLTEKFGFSYLEVGVLVLKVYGPLLILLGLGGLGIILYILPNIDSYYKKTTPLLTILIAVSFAWTPIEFFGGNLIASWGRALRLGQMLSPIFAGIFLMYLFNSIETNVTGKTFRTILIFLSISALLTTGLVVHQGAMYDSPWVEQSNTYITESEITGWQWYFDSKSTMRGTVTLNRRSHRFMQLLMTPNERIERRNDISYRDPNMKATAPPHFGGTTPLGDMFRDTYYIDTKPVRLNRIVVHPSWQFTENDFELLESDRSVNRIYDNENFRAHTIN
ncbi:hypothetical protein HPS36_03900 [Halorubrum salinarum]|uniref:Glycosyltransferase RgtA/B/C/D-like domain-containing protein n=1 Tax=Halorubrum salinarum TaxID=2739057 RepID=A0A7D3XY04_9EURY|nr:hypothetical protein [Halorubrum salinarum]QKG92034.1 hypothetical protein HPS36_03900 [Halorubrum salinarum]